MDANLGPEKLACVVTFDVVRDLLKIAYRKNHNDRQLRRTVMAPSPPDDIIAGSAHLINKYAPTDPRHIRLGRNQILWATTAAEIASIQGTTPAGPALAERLRDRLGLVHHNPVVKKRQIHLFAFEANKSFEDLSKDEPIRCNRPTVIEGFDNPRFRQRTDFVTSPYSTCGRTVDLNRGNYTPGSPEVITTEIAIADTFSCRYVGPVVTPPAGDERAFIKFLSQRRRIDDMIAKLATMR